jgi:hypothetical protein
VVGCAEHVEKYAFYGESLGSTSQLDHLLEAVDMCFNLFRIAKDALQYMSDQHKLQQSSYNISRENWASDMRLTTTCVSNKTAASVSSATAFSGS